MVGSRSETLSAKDTKDSEFGRPTDDAARRSPHGQVAFEDFAPTAFGADKNERALEASSVCRKNGPHPWPQRQVNGCQIGLSPVESYWKQVGVGVATWISSFCFCGAVFPV